MLKIRTEQNVKFTRHSFWYNQYSTQVSSDVDIFSTSFLALWHPSENAHLSGRLHNNPLNVCPAYIGPWVSGTYWSRLKRFSSILALDPSPLEIRNRLIVLTLLENTEMSIGIDPNGHFLDLTLNFKIYNAVFLTCEPGLHGQVGWTECVRVAVVWG